MVKVRNVHRDLLDKPVRLARTLTPAQMRREALDAQLRRVINRLAGPGDVFEIGLEEGEKAITVRQRINKVAAAAGVAIAVRKSGDNALLVGLLTPDRRTSRGRRRRSAQPSTPIQADS